MLFRRVIVIGRFFTKVFLCLWMTHLYAFCWQEKCMVIVDAGSTGSRLSIFSYDLDESNWPIRITERGSHKIQPGLASLQALSSEVDAYLSSLFENVPQDEFPVYFYATGGMRLLSLESQTKMYGVVRDWFQKKTHFKLKELRTISGEEEGVFAWLSVNDDKNVLQGYKEAVGVLDTGGASVQIAFPIKGENKSDKNIKKLAIGDNVISLYVRSLLGAGQTPILEHFSNEPSCFMKDYMLPSGILAEGDAFECVEHVSHFLNDTYDVNKEIGSVVRTNPVSRWYVMGGLAYLLKEPVFMSLQEKTPKKMINVAETLICHQPFETMKNTYKDTPRLYAWCLLPAYYYALIVNGYGVSSEALLILADEKNQNWTYGALLFIENEKNLKYQTLKKVAISSALSILNQSTKNIADLENSLYTAATAVVAQSVEQLIRNQ